MPQAPRPDIQQQLADQRLEGTIRRQFLQAGNTPQAIAGDNTPQGQVMHRDPQPVDDVADILFIGEAPNPQAPRANDIPHPEPVQLRPRRTVVLKPKQFREAVVSAAQAWTASLTSFKDHWNMTHPADEQVNYNTLHSWLQQAKTNQGVLPDRKSPGRQPLLNAQQSRRVEDMLIKVAGNHTSFDSNLVRIAGKEVYSETPQGRYKINEGAVVFSESWAKTWLHQRNWDVRKATSDRTVTGQQIVDAGEKFFHDIRQVRGLCVKPELWFNMDEFFILLDANRNWTWYRATGESKVVQIAKNKWGTTMSITTNPFKPIVMQMIWEGATNQVYADTARQPCPMIMQQHRAGTHFQNGATFMEWAGRFIDEVSKIRAEKGFDPKEPAVLFLDQAGQHTQSDELRQLFMDNAIHVMDIPKKMTHIFQPADQLIIPVIKQKGKELANARVAQAVHQDGLDGGLKTILDKSRAILRRHKYEEMAFALEDLCGPNRGNAMKKSWGQTGILRAMDCTDPRLTPYMNDVIFDTYVKLVRENGLREIQDDIECFNANGENQRYEMLTEEEKAVADAEANQAEAEALRNRIGTQQVAQGFLDEGRSRQEQLDRLTLNNMVERDLIAEDKKQLAAYNADMKIYKKKNQRQFWKQPVKSDYCMSDEEAAVWKQRRFYELLIERNIRRLGVANDKFLHYCRGKRPNRGPAPEDDLVGGEDEEWAFAAAGGHCFEH